MEQELNDLLQHLEIREDEEQGIVLEEDLEDLKAEARWTALAKVSSSKAFSHTAFFANMKYAWNLAKDARFKAIEENLFVVQFSCLGDWSKVMDEGPWFFRGHAVLLEEYDGITKPSKVQFNHLAMWVRIYDLPTGFRTKNIGRQLGDKIGKFLKVELDDDFSGWRDYLRIRIKMDISKPLTRIIYVSLGADGKREAFRVKYEKLPKFCAVCGLIGHADTECGDGVHDKKSFQYGDWLIASPERKVKVIGSRFLGSADTKGSDSREQSKYSLSKRSNETNKNAGSSQRDSVGDDVDIQVDARSPLNKDSENACGELIDNNQAMALVPVTNKLEILGNNIEEFSGCQLMKDGDSKGLVPKRQRMEEWQGEDIEMRSASSLVEYRREQ